MFAEEKGQDSSMGDRFGHEDGYKRRRTDYHGREDIRREDIRREDIRRESFRDSYDRSAPPLRTHDYRPNRYNDMQPREMYNEPRGTIYTNWMLGVCPNK